MKSIQLVAPRTLELREMPMPPDPGPGEVLVRLRAVGICGSDLHWYLEGGIGPNRCVYPQILGHEPAGEIAAVGKGVTELSPGQRVAVEPAITCGVCEFCRSGRHNNCVSSAFMGTPQIPGLFREYAVVPAQNIVPVPNALSFPQITVIEPLAVIVHILELTKITIGDTVAVFGAGPIGLLTTAVARLSGASTIFVVDKVQHRLEIARQMGADVVVNNASAPVRDAILDHTRGRGVDIVFDAAGKEETINAGIDVARLGGQFVLIGIPSEQTVPLDLHAAMSRELNIQIIKRSNHNDDAAIQLLESGRVPSRLVTHRVPLEKTPDLFETLAAYADGVGKVVIEIP